EGTSALTSQGTLLGTPEYMAPEQAEVDEGREIDWRADLYALGVVAYEMLVGRPPFIGKSPTAVLYKHVHEAPPAPTSLKPALLPGFEPVLLRALEKQREARFQHAGDFAAALMQAYEEAAQQEAVQPPIPVQPQLRARAPKRLGTAPGSRTWIRWAVGAGLAIFVIVCAYIGFAP
ncbi:MAG: protein kinase domain-containing protein, partial [Anaerolineae bacterium]